MNSALVIEDVAKSFGQVVALREVSIELAPHELLALVGPSGCGKSTLLRAIAGLVPPDRGRISLGDRVVDDGRRHVPPEHRRVGLVFQEHTLFPHLTVADNVAFGLRGSGKTRARARVSEMLDLVELGGYTDRYPHELSGGERQRVALARALAPSPDLLLLDEPFASLDPNLRVQLRRGVLAALHATSTPAVFVTHDQSEAMAVGDRIAVMRAGRLEQVGEPAAVYHSPVNRFVGAFMGEASFLAVESGPDGKSTILGPVRDSVPEGAVAMVRPDAVEFTPDLSGDATIVDAEFRGGLWAYTIELGDQRIVTTVSHLIPISIGVHGTVSLRAGHRQLFLT
jgi:iron(III) transport system ATP-binding protein